jgi:signal transduction histidine kinase
MVLMFLRLDSASTDYLFQTCDLDALVRSCIKKFAGEFIRRKVRLDYTPAAAQIVTDEKWLAFVIEQILSNALKYTPSGGTVSIYLEGGAGNAPQTLCIRDTGIGIAPEDLPRIFDKGYTGWNGRADRQASGIGLYLCRRVCDALGHSLAAASAPGAGTTLRIGLARRAPGGE